jgi:hypothetical protein
MERRQDVGLKISFVIFSAIITILLGLFFTKTYESAARACEVGTGNTKDIAVLRSEYNLTVAEIYRRINNMDGKLDVLIGLKLKNE